MRYNGCSLYIDWWSGGGGGGGGGIFSRWPEERNALAGMSTDNNGGNGEEVSNMPFNRRLPRDAVAAAAARKRARLRLCV